MEICKAPTQRLKALNKHTHIMYIEIENVIQKTTTNKQQTNKQTKQNKNKNKTAVCGEICDDVGG